MTAKLIKSPLNLGYVSLYKSPKNAGAVKDMPMRFCDGGTGCEACNFCNVCDNCNFCNTCYTVCNDTGCQSNCYGSDDYIKTAQAKPQPAAKRLSLR